MMMMDRIPLIIRGLQLLWALLLTALIGNVIALNISAAGTATAAVNFAMFVVVVAWLAALFGLASAFVDRIAIPMAVLGADLAATLFSLIAGIVLAAKLRAVNCGSWDDLQNQPADWIAYGSADDGKRCRELQASTVFMWFLCLSFGAGLALSYLGFRRGGVGAGSVRSGPTMSQVRV